VADLVAHATITQLKLEEFLPYRLAILSASVSRGLAQIHERFGLERGEWLLLTTLGETGQTTATAFGAQSGMHKTRVSRAVAALLQRGLILRIVSQTDRRQAQLRLSPAGKHIHDQMVPLIRVYLERLEDGLPPEDRAALDRSLKRLGERSRQMMRFDPFAVGAAAGVPK
jgi:DNA-binding MarR family transcriptional regulator